MRFHNELPRPGLALLTSLRALTLHMGDYGGAADYGPGLEEILQPLSRLTSLALVHIQMPRVPPAVAGLTMLRRFACYVDRYGGLRAHLPPSLPATLEWLAVSAADPGLLALLPTLPRPERLCLINAGKAGADTGVAGVLQWAGQQPDPAPLRQLDLWPGGPAEQLEAAAQAAVAAQLNMPALQISDGAETLPELLGDLSLWQWW